MKTHEAYEPLREMAQARCLECPWFGPESEMVSVRPETQVDVDDWRETGQLYHGCPECLAKCDVGNYADPTPQQVNESITRLNLLLNESFNPPLVESFIDQLLSITEEKT